MADFELSESDEVRKYNDTYLTLDFSHSEESGCEQGTYSYVFEELKLGDILRTSKHPSEGAQLATSVLDANLYTNQVFDHLPTYLSYRPPYRYSCGTRAPIGKIARRAGTINPSATAQNQHSCGCRAPERQGGSVADIPN